MGPIAFRKHEQVANKKEDSKENPAEEKTSSEESQEQKPQPGSDPEGEQTESSS